MEITGNWFIMVTLFISTQLQMINSHALGFPRPGILRRLAAMMYDSLLLLALLIIIGGAWISLTVNGSALATWGLRVIFVLLPSGFFIYFWQKSGQTLGMTTWRLRLRSIDDENLSLKKMIVRLIIASLSIACCGLGYVWMLIDKDHLTWHDRISKTALELLPKKEKKK